MAPPRLFPIAWLCAVSAIYHLAPCEAKSRRKRPRFHVRRMHGPDSSVHGSSLNCTWTFVEQPVSHFVPGVTEGATYQQRLCIYAGFWKGGRSPILFYTGNEDPVDEYVNGTGQMWEMGPEFGALLVFAEHRYFGESMPQLQGLIDCVAYLTPEEALADFASLVEKFHNDQQWQWYAPRAPVITFGGSYGGMLSAWFRMRYPNHVAGAISASGPIVGFPQQRPAIDSAAVALTNSITEVGGAPASCLPNVKAAWVLLHDIGKTSAGRDLLNKRLGLCTPLRKSDDVADLLDYLQVPWFQLAEGSYPFASDYIVFDATSGGTSKLPAWPAREVCKPISRDFGVSLEGDVHLVKFVVRAGDVEVNVDWNTTTNNRYSIAALERSKAVDMIAAVVEGLQVWYNVTGTVTCLNWSTSSDDDSAAVPAPGSEVRKDEKEKASSNATQDETTRRCTKNSLPHDISWDVIVCNAGLNMPGTAIHGLGRDLYWPPNVERDVSYESIVTGHWDMDDCGTYKEKGFYGIPDKVDKWGKWVDTLYGGETKLSSYSNIFFSNGNLDPWSSAGVAPPGPTHKMPAAIIDGGGHHLDLFASTATDSASVKEVRKMERNHIRKWIEEAWKAQDAQGKKIEPVSLAAVSAASAASGSWGAASAALLLGVSFVAACAFVLKPAVSKPTRTRRSVYADDISTPYHIGLSA